MNDLLKQLSPVEWVAAVATLINVWLTVRADIRNYVFGIVGVVLYAWVFWTQSLYANAGLQVLYYLPMQFIGWWVWLRTGPKREDDLPVGRLSTRANLGWAVATVLGTVAVGLLMDRTTDNPQPYVDGFTTVASVVGQYMLARKWLENWWYWIVVDVVYAGYLFPKMGLWVSAGLYVILLVLCIVGLRGWLEANRKGAAHV